MTNLNKFDTQIQIEETSAYEPTAQDLAEFGVWADEMDMEEANAECNAEADEEWNEHWDEFDGELENFLWED
jgi:hypothetical protein|tara:strand:- start:957 stop:1172 length:216 start_codon:yes stop_codon:yes gene_type:complete